MDIKRIFFVSIIMYAKFVWPSQSDATKIQQAIQKVRKEFLDEKGDSKCLRYIGFWMDEDHKHFASARLNPSRYKNYQNCIAAENNALKILEDQINQAKETLSSEALKDVTNLLQCVRDDITKERYLENLKMK
jgi:hypothetical protein